MNRLKLDIFNRFRNQHYIKELTEWELTKSYKDYTVQIDLNQPFRYDNKTAYKYLLDMAVLGPKYLEVGPITDSNCGVSIPCRVESLEGTADHKNMIFDKTPDLNGEVRFNEKANIFDSESETVTIFNGTVETLVRTKDAVEFDPDFTVDGILALVPPDNEEGNGYYLQRVRIECNPRFNFNPNAGPVGYRGHVIEAQYRYYRVLSNELLPGWVPFQTGYVYPIPKPVVEGYHDEDPFEGDQDGRGRETKYRGQSVADFQEGEISNVRDFNQLLEQIFPTNYISNFFGVNADSSEPDNKYYEFAVDFCQRLRIVQGRDITVADSDVDSVGISGKIDPDKLIADLNNMFNLTLVFDTTTGKIRHEHISYWRSKQITFSDYKLEPYKFNASRVTSESWRNSTSGADARHQETEIRYLQQGTQEVSNTIEILVTDFLSFLDTAEGNTIEDVDKKFFLLSTDDNGIISFNDPLAIRNLVQNLHDLNRPSRNGIQDDDNVTFVSSSIGITTELTVKESLATFLVVHPQMAVSLEEGTFFIDELSIDQHDQLTIQLKK